MTARLGTDKPALTYSADASGAVRPNGGAACPTPLCYLLAGDAGFYERRPAGGYGVMPNAPGATAEPLQAEEPCEGWSLWARRDSGWSRVAKADPCDPRVYLPYYSVDSGMSAARQIYTFYEAYLDLIEAGDVLEIRFLPPQAAG